MSPDTAFIVIPCTDLRGPKQNILDASLHDPQMEGDSSSHPGFGAGRSGRAFQSTNPETRQQAPR